MSMDEVGECWGGKRLCLSPLVSFYVGLSDVFNDASLVIDATHRDTSFDAPQVTVTCGDRCHAIITGSEHSLEISSLATIAIGCPLQHMMMMVRSDEGGRKRSSVCM